MRRRNLRATASLLALTLLMASCGGDGGDDGAETTDGATDDGATDDGATDDDGASGDGDASGDAVTFRIGTASSAGAFYAIAGGLADVLNRGAGFNATAQTTPGSSAPNVQMLAAGDIEAGFVTSDQAAQGYLGEGPFPQPNEGLRAIAAGNVAEVQIVARADSGIESIEELEGARIGAGAEGSFTEASTSAMMDAYGITNWTPVYGSNADNLDALRDGTVDAVNTPLGAPSPGLTEIEATLDINWLSLDQERVDAILEDFPYWVAVTIEPGVYESLEEEYVTFGYSTVIVTQDSVDEDVIYDFVTVLYDSNDELVNVHPAAEAFTHENAARGVQIPFHPGAERYFDEQGVSLSQ